MEANLLYEGLMLMLVGMGTVFVFLTLLVMAMSLMARMLKSSAPMTGTGASDEEVAAISAAITMHRNKNS